VFQRINVHDKGCPEQELQGFSLKRWVRNIREWAEVLVPGVTGTTSPHLELRCHKYWSKMARMAKNLQRESDEEGHNPGQR
jgi:hypothetical protein